MTLYEYLSLPDPLQDDTIFQEGTLIEVVVERKSRFLLYALDKFFVEIEYCSDENKIINKRAFVGGELLDKYSNLDSL